MEDEDFVNFDRSLLPLSTCILPEFHVSDYLLLPEDEERRAVVLNSEEDDSGSGFHSSKLILGGCGRDELRRDYRSGRKCRSEGKDVKTVLRVAFRTKSKMEIMDDGFKWRKYGKKMVKNSPNPRNYYRCSSRGCFVKKMVEREKEDPSYVITTYEGVHNHESPSFVYINNMSLLV